MSVQQRRFAVVLTLALAGCTEQAPDISGPITVPVLASANANGGNYGTTISPDEEVMPPGVVNTSQAVGNAVFQLSADGTELSYKLIVANIENVFQAHLHLGPVGEAGGIVVWLYPSAPPAVLIPGRSDGVLAEGEITAANLVGALAGQPLSALLDAIEAGNVYVNVHTNDFVAPINTGAGDFPGGEIRGQVSSGDPERGS